MNEARLVELYKKYGPLIYARCRRILTDASAAEDAAQETFLRVLRHLDSAPSSDEALFWVYRIATNYCLNELRARKYQRELNAEVSGVIDTNITEERLADRDLARRLVLQAPEQIRVAAWLYHVDGLHQAEVAQVLGVSRRTVVSYLSLFTRQARKLVSRSAA